MKKVSVALAFFLIWQVMAVVSAADTAQDEREYLQNLLHGLCSIGSCDKTLNPHAPKEAEEIIRNAAYIIYNTQYDKLAKYNEPLRKMGIENAMLIPPKWVEDAVCEYYGFDINRIPELQKAAEEQARFGFYAMGASDGALAGYEIEKIDLLKNGILRASGQTLEEESFIAYFGKSTCGGKTHWTPLRVVDPVPLEESANFSPLFK